ncbi:MAG TPA: hypothetical protein VEZ89_18520 [Rubrivivax sp.]|nr:hypothetical protein [Rubrivivax sp.]
MKWTLVFSLALAAAVAQAAPPANIAGTTWTLQANREVNQLVITHQGGAGAPGSAVCRLIIGTIGIAPIRGWYCPTNGRIHFLHNNLNSNVTMRVFTGNVSDEVVGQPLYMGGSVAVDNIGAGDLGEYNFAATQ